MKQFDYRRAWFELAGPLYDRLPDHVRALLARVAETSVALVQRDDYTMAWPDDAGALRAAFAALPSDLLAGSARVVYYVGHWQPSGADAESARQVPGPSSGATWKYSDYADQVLRDRLGVRARGPGTGAHLEIHEGVLRVCYSARDLWTWAEVAPATEDGRTFAEHAAESVQLAAREAFERGRRRSHRRAAAAIERLRADRSGFPGEWSALMDTERYHVEESEIVRVVPPRDIEQERRKVDAHTEAKIAALNAERSGLLWLLDHGCEIENVIYYSHTRRFCVGWRHALTPAAISTWLDVLCEFPYGYDIKGYRPPPVTP